MYESEAELDERIKKVRLRKVTVEIEFDDEEDC